MTDATPWWDRHVRPDGTPYSTHPKKKQRQLVTDGAVEPKSRQRWTGRRWEKA